MSSYVRAFWKRVWGEYKCVEWDWARCKKCFLSHQSARVLLLNIGAFSLTLAWILKSTFAHSSSYLHITKCLRPCYYFPLVISCVREILVKLINGTWQRSLKVSLLWSLFSGNFRAFIEIYLILDAVIAFYFRNQRRRNNSYLSYNEQEDLQE